MSQKNLKTLRFKKHKQINHNSVKITATLANTSLLKASCMKPGTTKPEEINKKHTLMFKLQQQNLLQLHSYRTQRHKQNENLFCLLFSRAKQQAEQLSRVGGYKQKEGPFTSSN